MSTEAIVQVRDLANRFGSQSVHEHLDLDIYRGEILAVVGGSGTGKSVLLRSIVGLREPSAGRVQVFGENLQDLNSEQRRQVERRFGVLFQKGALFSSLTVRENIALPLIEHAGLSRADAEELAQLKVALAGLPANAGGKYPTELSGGMIKRAALARALALDPELLFLDEPTAGLDPLGAQAFVALIAELRALHGLTAVMVTHELERVAPLLDRVAVLADRRVVAIGPLAAVRRADHPFIQAYFAAHDPQGENHGK